LAKAGRERLRELSNHAWKADNPAMPSRRIFQLSVIVLTVALCAVALWASKDFVPPHAENASTYACKDAHPTEKVTVATDVYNNSPKADIFNTPYNQEGILPVFLIISNDGDQPVTVKDMQAELVTAGRAKLESLTADDIFRRVAHISGSSTSPARVGPIPLGGNKNKKAQKQYEEIMNAIFTAAAVEPHTTKSGFLFFDVRNVKQPVDGAHLYLTGVRDSNGNELMYFEVPLVPSNASGRD
jgi:hypothetical protein